MVARSIELPVDDDGRVTIPLDAQRRLGVGPGDVVRLEAVARDDDHVGDQRAGFLKHFGTLTLVEELRDGEDFESRIREVMEEAAIQRYRRSL